ncbi:MULTISPECIES: helix-turn-helix transcriptional regulator [unclassified Streptomyces]|uniref:helix-turn-helix domain-containing protein n=1 Tax=unclassified Streptomyces TaxID=2593676 RepID=UPI00225B410D|nr:MULTISPECIES: helix-turn-helix transcriptional regulator [unclassified Streptomyces]MCX5163566.1 helix-turn-helix transcriptional regulator [Streptomyces sp. NBC_00305]MCX5222090.1 helix-turn-helix transcriptional regulator [Streptomyces sp. NBC_00264]WSP51859.1 helix-turn-helix transcriptional regulator [Streptomyces sp. NBC_01243]WSX07132.1 helix-turn-helix transcriptional regulator [Streptomyces sp. NBC_00987]
MEPYDGDDEESAAVLRTIGRVVKSCRERKGLTQAELGTAIGYSEEQVSSVERGRRAPSEVFLEKADRVLGAGGLIAGLKKDAEEARFPKKVRDLAKLEAKAVEICTYDNSVVNGLLQTAEYLKAVFGSRRPAFTEEEVERLVAARLARQRIIGEKGMIPAFNFVQDEAALRRPVGGKMVLRRQLERLLEIGQMRNVEVQVLPLDREDNAGLDGPFHLLRLKEGTTVGHTDIQLVSRLISDRREVQILELRYGIIRAQALTPRESLAYIEKLLGET